LSNSSAGRYTFGWLNWWPIIAWRHIGEELAGATCGFRVDGQPIRTLGGSAPWLDRKPASSSAWVVRLSDVQSLDGCFWLACVDDDGTWDVRYLVVEPKSARMALAYVLCMSIQIGTSLTLLEYDTTSSATALATVDCIRAVVSTGCLVTLILAEGTSSLAACGAWTLARFPRCRFDGQRRVCLQLCGNRQSIFKHCVLQGCKVVMIAFTGLFLAEDQMHISLIILIELVASFAVVNLLCSLIPADESVALGAASITTPESVAFTRAVPPQADLEAHT